MTSMHPDAPPTFTDYLRMLRRWRRTGAAIVGAVLLATLIFTLTADKEYVASASLLPEAAGADAGGLSAMLMSKFGIFPGLNEGPATPGDIALSILGSKTVAGAVVDSVHLVEAWEVGESTPERAREVAIDMLHKRLRITQDEHTMIKLRVSDESPERAAAIANAFLNELDRANQMFSTGSAARTRRFVEQRLDETRGELSAAQDSLQAFQRKHGALAVDEQTKTTVAVIAKLQGESEALKAKRDAMRFSMSDRSSEMRSLDAQIAALEGRVQSLVAPGLQGAGGTGVLLKLQDVPGLAAEYAQLLLAVETQAAVFGMLAQQVEQAKIEETRNTPTVRILDRAATPLYRSRPRNKLNMVVGLVLGCALALVAILALDRMAPQEGAEGDRWRALLRRSPLSSAG
jgi:tyrosine-protein kinase Etk/Wzc